MEAETGHDEERLAVTTLGKECMDDFHLIVPKDVVKGTADTSWELSGRDGMILRGDQFGDSSTFYSHHACLRLGTYNFTTWKDSTAQYSLSYRKTTLSNEDLDLDQPGTLRGTVRLDVFNISELSFNGIDIGNVGTLGNSSSSSPRDWIVEGSGTGIRVSL